MKNLRIVTSGYFVGGALAVIFLMQCPGVYAGSSYDPSIKYKGGYAPNRLFYYNEGAKGHKWLAGCREESTFPKSVACPDALKELQQNGFWKGQLTDDCTCGEEAPLRKWAVGNWLNYYKSSSGSR